MCDIEPGTLAYSTAAQSQLSDGLHFLDQAFISSTPLCSAPKIALMHPREDKVIPLQCGQLCSSLLNTPLTQLPGGHATWLSNSPTAVKSCILDTLSCKKQSN
jgi:hypothetical protein